MRIDALEVPPPVGAHLKGTLLVETERTPGHITKRAAHTMGIEITKEAMLQATGKIIPHRPLAEAMIIEEPILVVTTKIVQIMNIIREGIIMRIGGPPVILTTSVIESTLLAIIAIVKRVIVDLPFNINLDMRKLKGMITEGATTEKDLLTTASKAPIRTGSPT